MDLKINHKQRTIFLWCTLIFIVFLYQLRFNFIEGSDDGWFALIKEKYSLADYLSLRYNTWSSRIFPETMLYYIFHIPINLWRMLNTAFIFLLATSIVRIFKGEIKIYNVVVVILLFGYSSFDVINSGFFWMTGSVNYLWPLALGAYVLIPFADKFFRKKTTKFSLKQLVRVIITCIFAISNEQLVLCAFGIMFVYHIYLFTIKEKPSIYLIILTLIVFAGILLMTFAPGNTVRFESEIVRWFPEFNELSFLGHMKTGIFWLFEQIITHFKLFILLISLLTINLLQSEKLKKIFYIMGTIILSLTIVKPTLLTDLNRINFVPFDSFENLLTRNFIIGVFPYIFWSIVLIYIIFCSCLVTRNPIFTFFCYLAGLLSCVLMFFSPTIYASGPRVLNALVLFLVLISFMLFQKNMEKKNSNPNFSLFLLSIFPLFSFLLN